VVAAGGDRGGSDPVPAPVVERGRRVHKTSGHVVFVTVVRYLLLQLKNLTRKELI
jgi:hypothetical protein